MTLSRHDILNALQVALEPLPYVHAMWQGGSVAFGKDDAWSDIDLQVDADDDKVNEVLALAERTLADVSPIELKYELPQPTWHGHAQAFYKLTDASEFLVVDLVVIRHSSPRKFTEPEIHGTAVVCFDKSEVVRTQPLDKDEWGRQLGARLASLSVTFPMFQPLIRKEIFRRRPIEAVAFYHSHTLRPLVELLRIRHSPFRHNFHSRLIYTDLPAEVIERLEALFFPADLQDLERKHAEAVAWWSSLMAAEAGTAER